MMSNELKRLLLRLDLVERLKSKNEPTIMWNKKVRDDIFPLTYSRIFLVLLCGNYFF